MKIRALAIIGAILMIAAIMTGPALGQAPAGPVTRYQTTFQIVNAPAQFDELLGYAEVTSGSATPPHIHGGNQYVTVLEGEITRQVYSPVPSVKLHQAGNTWSELTGEVHQVFNRGTVTARTIGTFLLPRGVPLTTIQQTGETSQQLPGPKTLAQAKLPVDRPPAQFELRHLVLDFQPGTSTQDQSYGGQSLNLVLAGTVTVRSNGAEKSYKAGESWSEEAGQVFAVASPTGEQASVAASVLLPTGASLITVRTPAGAPAMTDVIGTVTSNMLVIAAAVMILLFGGVLLWRVRARARKGI